MSPDKELSDFIRRQRAYGESSALPLKNVRVIDMGTVIAAPFTATLLGDFGAEVIKIENHQGIAFKKPPITSIIWFIMFPNTSFTVPSTFVIFQMKGPLLLDICCLCLFYPF